MWVYLNEGWSGGPPRNMIGLEPTGPPSITIAWDTGYYYVYNIDSWRPSDDVFFPDKDYIITSDIPAGWSADPNLQQVSITLHTDVDCAWLYANTLLLAAPDTQTVNTDIAIGYGSEILFKDGTNDRALIGYHDYSPGRSAVEVGCEEYGMTLNTYDFGDVNVGKHILVNLKNADGDLPDELVAYVSDLNNINSSEIHAASVYVSTLLSLTYSTFTQYTKLQTGQSFNSTNSSNGIVSILYNEADGGGSQCRNVNSSGVNEMYVGTNSAGDGSATQDFVEIYAKTTEASSDPEDVGTRLFITPGSDGGFGINAGNDKVWVPGSGINQCDMYFTNVGLHISGDIWLTGEVHPNGSQTITHKTNIINFKPDQIGCFCETTGEISNVYGADYEPTLDRATDAICKVKASNVLNSRIVGIITDYDRFANSGDVLMRVVDDVYSLGELLVPDISGLCRKCADDGERLSLVLNGCPRAKITTITPGGEFVACFSQ
jgi:hypothetical protein